MLGTVLLVATLVALFALPLYRGEAIGVHARWFAARHTFAGEAGMAVLTPAPSQPKNDQVNAKGNGAAMAPTRFVRASNEHTEPATDNTLALTAAQQLLGPLDIPAYGYYRSLLLYVEATAAGNAATVAFKEDAPWSVIAELVVSDVNGAPLFGPVSGYDLYLSYKYGGYNNDGDPTRSPAYVAPITGAGATGGSFSFVLRIPQEVTGRDAFGALPNASAAATYKLRITVAASSDVYSTAPTVLPPVRFRTWLEAWAQPQANGLRGEPQQTQPEAYGTTQYWSKSPVNINAGSQIVRLTRMGNLIRTLVLVFRTTAPARSTVNFPDPLSLYWDGRLIHQVARPLWQHWIQERYGYTGAQIDTGVLVLEFTHEFDMKPGGELRDLYLPTTQATRLELQGNWGAAGVLTVLTDDVAPAGVQPAAA